MIGWPRDNWGTNYWNTYKALACELVSVRISTKITYFWPWTHVKHLPFLSSQEACSARLGWRITLIFAFFKSSPISPLSLSFVLVTQFESEVNRCLVNAIEGQCLWGVCVGEQTSKLEPLESEWQTFAFSLTFPVSSHFALHAAQSRL